MTISQIPVWLDCDPGHDVRWRAVVVAVVVTVTVALLNLPHPSRAAATVAYIRTLLPLILYLSTLSISTCLFHRFLLRCSSLTSSRFCAFTGRLRHPPRGIPPAHQAARHLHSLWQCLV